MSLEDSDKRAAAVAKKPDERVSLERLKSRIVSEHYQRADNAFNETGESAGPLSLLTICVLVLDTGWTLVGSSACVSYHNFNAELGRELAYEDALAKLWPLEGYLLRNELDDK